MNGPITKRSKDVAAPCIWTAVGGRAPRLHDALALGGSMVREVSIAWRDFKSFACCQESKLFPSHMNHVIVTPLVLEGILGHHPPSSLQAFIVDTRIIIIITFTAMPSLPSFSAALLALVAILSISTFTTPAVEATALTYNVAAHERACFYTYASIPKKKLAFYFAVSKQNHC
jgi:hypothetical protein